MKTTIALFLLAAAIMAGVYFLRPELFRPSPPPATSAIPEQLPTAEPAASPKQPEAQPRLAPDGVLYVIKRFSEQTPAGMRGFSPGMEVRLQRQEAGYYVVTDGSVVARRPRSWFTRNMDLADILRTKGELTQKEILDRLADERRWSEKRGAVESSSALPSAGAMGGKANNAQGLASSAPRGVASKIRIGAWNLEFFGSRTDPPRTKEDEAAVADFIRKLDLQALAVCEVNGERPLRELCRNLGGSWKFVIGSSGDLGMVGGPGGRIAPGILWDDSRLELISAGELVELKRKGGGIFHRIPVTAAFRDRSGGPDFRMIAVHLKAGRESADFTKREAEATALRKYVAKLTANPDEDRDIVVLGDFNHDPNSQEAKILQQDRFANYLTEQGGGRSIIHFNRQIDQIVPFSGFSEIIPRSFDIHNEQGMRDPKAWRTRYSDHFPVTAELQAVPDDDPKATFSRAERSLR